MPNHTSLVLLASLTACELETISHRVEEPTQPEAEKTATPAEAAPDADAKPAITLQPRLAPLVDGTADLDRRCMTRAGCRWGNQVERPRVTKKLVVPVPAQPASATSKP
jgi:hypothetical protein